MAASTEGTKSVIESREWYLAAYAPDSVPTSHHLKLRTIQVSLSPDSIPEGHVALEILFVSVEPYLRTKMSGLPDGLSAKQYELNQVIT